MTFDVTEEQQLLKASVDRLVSGHYSFGDRRSYEREPEGWSRAMWERYAELGLLGLPFAAEYGGFGCGPAEVALVMEAFGRGLVLEPYLATVVLGGGAIRLAGTDEQKREILPRIASGELIMAFAHAEPQSRYDLAPTATTAATVNGVNGSGGWRLDGEKSLVIHGDCADKLVVSARIAGSDETGLFMVDATAAGVSRRGYATQDGLRAANFKFNEVTVEDRNWIGADRAVLPVIEQLIQSAIAALAAEAVGVMQEMLDLTIDYLKTRQQFGVPIGSFQALQHRAVDMYMAHDAARSMALYASMMTEETDPLERSKAISAAKVQIGRSCRLVGQQAIQLHGGIGMTMEAKIGQCFLRSSAIEQLFGDADYHLAMLARAGGLITNGD